MANEATESFGILVEALANLQDANNGSIGITLPKVISTFQEYVIPFWFRESIFRQDADLGFLSDQSRSTDNTGKLNWINLSVCY